MHFFCEKKKESSPVTHLYDLGDSRLGFALKNGAIGVYYGDTKLWKHQLKDKVTSIAKFDISDNTMTTPKICMIVGWANGMIEARNIETGNIEWQTNVAMKESIAGIVIGDLRGDGKDQLITVTTNGLITAWIPKTQEIEKQINDTGTQISYADEQKLQQKIAERDVCRRIFFQNF